MTPLVLASLLFVTNPQDVTAAAGDLIAALRGGEFARVEAQFDDKMKAAMPLGRLEGLWKSLQLQAGAIKGCDTSAARVVAIADKQMVITPCEFEHAKLNVQFAFDGSGKVSGLSFRPASAPAAPYSLPPYANPSSYVERDVIVGAGGAWPLPGSLTMPVGDGPFPAVVLVHGSGPNDRDETIGANKPFKDLALGLASRGIAVLRYDKRTKVFAGRMSGASITVKDETVDDAVAALALLRTQAGIDPARVFVLGHSLGAMLVPRIVAAEPKLAGAIVMAGPARTIGQAIVEQTKYIAAADGTVSAEEQTRIDQMTKDAAAIEALTPEDATRGAMAFNVPASYWLDLRGYDPPSAAKAIKAPMLVLQGERDYQVTMEEFARWKTALAGRTDVTFHSYPALNHLFLPGTGKSLPAEYDQPSHVAPQVVDDIAAWVRR